MTSRFSIEPLGPETFELFAALHGRAGCYCMYWQYDRDNRAWQLEAPERNREAKRERVAGRSTHGLLAIDRDLTEREGRAIAVGSIQLEPRGSLTKLTARMPYRDLGPSEGRWSVACLYVAPEHRRRGVARALLDGAITWLRDERGAQALEAYPRLGDDLRDEEQWMGPESLFARAGFEVAREHVQYPVLVLPLRARGARRSGTS